MTSWLREGPMILALLMGLAVVIWSGCSLWRSAADSELVEGPRLSDVLSGVKEELRIAREHSDLAALPELRQVEVELEVQISESSEGNVSASVVPLGATAKQAAKWSEVSTQKVNVVLEAPRRSLTQETVELAGHDLARAIVQVAEDLERSSETKPRLDVSKVEFEVKFTVSKSQTSEGGFELKVAGATAKKGLENQVSHKVKLLFAPPPPPKKEKASWDDG